MDFLIQNAQGAKKSHFTLTLQEHIWQQNVCLVAILEPIFNEMQANKVYDKIGLKEIVHVENEGISGGI